MKRTDIIQYFYTTRAYIIMPLLLSIFVFFSGCEKYPPDDHLSWINKKVKTNMVVIAGEGVGENEVELSYSILDGDTNKMVTQKVSLPYILEPREVMLKMQKEYDPQYTSVKSWNEDEFHYNIFTHPSIIKPKANEFFITNHSNKPIEFFIVGEAPFKQSEANDTAYLTDGEKITNYIKQTPYPIYKSAPIYYLLYPEKTPNKEGLNWVLKRGWKNDSLLYRNIALTPNKIGTITLDRAWTIDEVMSLYRDDFNASASIELYCFVNENGYYDYIYQPLRSYQVSDTERLKMYGKIEPQTSFRATIEYPLLQLPCYVGWGKKISIDATCIEE